MKLEVVILQPGGICVHDLLRVTPRGKVQPGNSFVGCVFSLGFVVPCVFPLIVCPLTWQVKD